MFAQYSPLPRQGDVTLGNSAGIVGGQGNIDAVVHVKPLGMMVRFFRKQGDLGHASERLPKIPKHQAAKKLAIAQAPGDEFLQDDLYLLGSQGHSQYSLHAVMHKP
jgi:hypothetical protein